MITLDSQLMRFDPLRAVEEKLNMEVIKKENTYQFRFSNGYKKSKTLKSDDEVRMYYIFLEEVYDRNPTNFAEIIKSILKGESTGEGVSITFHTTQSMGLKCKVEVTYYENGTRIASSSKRGGNIYSCYKFSKKELHKKLLHKKLEMLQVKDEVTKPEPVHNVKEDFINYLKKQVEMKDSQIESLEQRVELLQLTTDTAIQKVILKYTKCHICGGELIIKESSEGNLFVGCVNYNDDVDAHKHFALPYDDFAKLLHRNGLLKTYNEWWHGL